MLESTSGDEMTEQKPSDKTTKRKQDHIDICLNFTNEIEMNKTTGFEDIHFIPKEYIISSNYFNIYSIVLII